MKAVVFAVSVTLALVAVLLEVSPKANAQVYLDDGGGCESTSRIKEGILGDVTAHQYPNVTPQPLTISPAAFVFMNGLDVAVILDDGPNFIVRNNTLNYTVIARLSTWQVHATPVTNGQLDVSSSLTNIPPLMSTVDCHFNLCPTSVNTLTTAGTNPIISLSNTPVSTVFETKACNASSDSTAVIIRLSCNDRDSASFTESFTLSFLVNINCSQAPPTTLARSSSMGNEIYGIAGAIVFVVVVFAIILFTSQSKNCRFTGGQVNYAHQPITASGTGTASTTAVTLVSARSSENGVASRNGSIHSHPDSRGARSYVERSLSGMHVYGAPMDADHAPPMPLGSLSYNSDGTDSHYENTSIGHTDWQSNKCVQELLVTANRLQLGDVVRSGTSLHVMLGHMSLPDGDSEPVLVKAFTKSASGSVVQKCIFEALNLRRAQQAERRKDTIDGIVGIVIPHENVPPILLYSHSPNEENLRAWLLRMKSQEISRQHAGDDNMAWGGENLSPIYLMSLSAQLARGCKYLAKHDIIHRDLAARNCIINGHKGTVKICDSIYAQELFPEAYLQHPTVPNLKVPLKWMSVEAFSEAIYGYYSDVWSFAVILWEVFTLGRLPYEGVEPKDFETYLRAGNRLEQPLRCPNSMFTIMGTCWALSPRDRPSFYRISQKISEELMYERYPPGDEDIEDFVELRPRVGY